MTDFTEAAFTVTMPGGNFYAVFADGRILGFPPGALINNRIPALIDEAIRDDRSANGDRS